MPGAHAHGAMHEPAQLYHVIPPPPPPLDTSSLSAAAAAAAATAASADSSSLMLGPLAGLAPRANRLPIALAAFVNSSLRDDAILSTPNVRRKRPLSGLSSDGKKRRKQNSHRTINVCDVHLRAKKRCPLNCPFRRHPQVAASSVDYNYFSLNLFVCWLCVLFVCFF